MLKLQNMVTNPVSTVFVFYTAWHIHTWVWRRGRGRTWGDSVLVPRAASSPWCSPKCHHWMQETISNSYIMYMLLSILYPQILLQQNLWMEFCINNAQWFTKVVYLEKIIYFLLRTVMQFKQQKINRYFFKNKNRWYLTTNNLK